MDIIDLGRVALWRKQSTFLFFFSFILTLFSFLNFEDLRRYIVVLAKWWHFYESWVRIPRTMLLDNVTIACTMWAQIIGKWPEAEQTLERQLSRDALQTLIYSNHEDNTEYFIPNQLVNWTWNLHALLWAKPDTPEAPKKIVICRTSAGPFFFFLLISLTSFILFSYTLWW